MSPNSLPARRVRPVDLLARRRSRLTRVRVRLPDGLRTTLHVASYDRCVVSPRVVVLTEPVPLVRWCRLNGVRDAVVGGFFLRSHGLPLGHVWVGGAAQPSVAFDAPWGAVRACVHAGPHGLAIARRDELAGDLAGDLLQAGPLLVAGIHGDAREFYGDVRSVDFDAALATETPQRFAGGPGRGPARIISDGQTGWLVPADDPDALVTALTEVAQDRAERERRGELARIVVRERYSWAGATEQLAGVLRSVVSSGAHGSPYPLPTTRAAGRRRPAHSPTTTAADHSSALS